MKRKNQNLRVHHVVDLRTGKVSPARYLLNQMTEQEKHELRSLQLGHSKVLNYACPACDQKVYLSGSGSAGNKTYHFRHFPNLGDCPIKDGHALSREDLLKIMYNGAKESDQHKKLKTWLGYFLMSIENIGDFGNTNIEKRITSLNDKLLWRQPDVSCTYKGKRLVFELQLNGTFVEVIRGREQFYHNEKTFICWLFDDFNPDNTDLSERDIFWLNKSNAFAITEETMHLSEEKQNLYIECHYVNPTFEDDVIKNEWVSCIVPFSELSLDEGYYKPFYFDSDSARNNLQRNLLVPEFIKYLLGAGRKKYGSQERYVNDASYIRKFDAMRPELAMPDEFSTGFVNIVDAVNFLKHGVTETMHHAFNNVKQYTNQIINFYPEFGFIYCMAVKTYRPDFKSDQLGDKLKKKVETFWKTYKSAEKEGRADGQNRSYNTILGIIFPELMDYVAAPSSS